MEICKVKQAIRKDMALRKKEYSETIRHSLSEEIRSLLEQHPLFQQASCVSLYHAVPDEVQTVSILNRWYESKQLALPLVQGDDLLLLQYDGPARVDRGALGICQTTPT